MDATKARHDEARAVGRRFGYLVAAAVNVAFLWIVNHLLEWGWPSFLTEDFAEVLPIMQLSLVATAAVNVVWAVWDPAWLKNVLQIGLNAIGLVMAVRTWEVFPFAFTPDAAAGETVARIILVVVILALTVDTIVRAVRLVTDPFTGADRPPVPSPGSSRSGPRRGAPRGGRALPTG